MDQNIPIPKWSDMVDLIPAPPVPTEVEVRVEEAQEALKEAVIEAGLEAIIED